jgi:hypothetical protein
VCSYCVPIWRLDVWANQEVGEDQPGGCVLMPGEGFEPPTFGLQNRCTTTVLTRQSVFVSIT